MYRSILQVNKFNIHIKFNQIIKMNSTNITSVFTTNPAVTTVTTTNTNNDTNSNAIGTNEQMGIDLNTNITKIKSLIQSAGKDYISNYLTILYIQYIQCILTI